MQTLLIITVIFALVWSISAFRQISSPVAANRFISMIGVGDAAPDFELKNSKGKSFKLSSYKNKKPVVVFFYPADNTPGCTTEACAFEKRAPDFKKTGAVVFGVSSGGPADKEKFIRANKLQSMELLIDEGDKLRSSWKVPKALFGAFPGRVTYVIGKDGKVLSKYDDLAKAAVHPEKALEALSAAK